MRVTVVIPTMNEPAAEEVVEEVYDALSGHDAEVLVVDRSSDDTPMRAEAAGARVVRQTGKGYGDAYIQGFSLVEDADAVAMLDADYTYDPYDLLGMLEPLENGSADVVVGNRFADMEPGAMSSRNRLGNRAISWFVRLLYRTPATDSQCGMRAFTADALRSMELRHAGMPFATEMLIDAEKRGLRVKEVPISYRARVGEEKLRPYKDAFSIVVTSVRLLRDYNPMKLFLPIGTLLILIGTVLGLTVVAQWLDQGSVTLFARSILSALFVLAGLQILFFGFLADLLVEAVRKS